MAIILFEGGLTLDLKGYRTASREILGILTIGVLVTWLGTAALVKLAFGFDLAFCLLAASLVIVTGPTVIGPLLHRIRAKPKLQSILHWEGVLIDPIGVFIALLCFEYYISTNGSHQLVLQDFHAPVRDRCVQWVSPLVSCSISFCGGAGWTKGTTTSSCWPWRC